MAKGNLIIAILRVYYLSMVKDINPKEPLVYWLVTTFLEPNVKGSWSVIRSHIYLFLKDNAILPRSVLISVLKGLNLLHLLKGKLASVCNHFNVQLVPLWSSVIRRHSFYDKWIPFSSIGLQNKVFKFHDVKNPLTLCLGIVLFASFTLVYKPDSHILKKILVIRNVYLHMQNSVSFCHLEVVLSKQMELSSFKCCDVTLVILHMRLRSSCRSNCWASCCKDTMNLLEVLCFCYYRNFSAESGNPEYVTLWSYEVRSQPYYRLFLGTLSFKGKEFAFEITHKGDIDRLASIVNMDWPIFL